MGLFAGKTLMITGGTGSFGNAVLNRFLRTDIREIRIFSRDEKKQDDMRHEYQVKYPEYENWLKYEPSFVAVPDIEKGYGQSGYSSAVSMGGCSVRVDGECLVSASYRYDFASTFYSVRCLKNE